MALSEKPDMWDLARATEEAQKQEGNWTVPLHAGGDDNLASFTLDLLYEKRGAKPPKGKTRTSQLEVIAAILRDCETTDQKVVSKALGLLFSRSGEWAHRGGNFNPMYPSFKGDFSIALGQAEILLEDIAIEDSEEWDGEDYGSVCMPVPEPVVLTEEQRIWKAVLGQIEAQVDRTALDTYLSRASLLRHENGTVVIGAKDEYTRNWLENRLAATIKRALVGIVGQVEVEFTVIS